MLLNTSNISHQLSHSRRFRNGADQNRANEIGMKLSTTAKNIFPENKGFDRWEDVFCPVPDLITNVDGSGESLSSAVYSGRAFRAPREKAYIETVSVMKQVPHMVEFSLNFSKRQEISFLQTPDPARLFEHRLHKYLAKVGLARLPFAFSFDVDDHGRLHAHGVIQLLPGTRAEVMTALRCAGGKICGVAGARQLVFTGGVDRDPAIWAKYTTRHRKKVRELFVRSGVKRVRSCYVSTSYRQLCRTLVS